MPSIRPEPLLLTALLAVATTPLLTGCGPMLVAGTAYGATVFHERRSPEVILDDEVIELQAKHIYLQSRDIADYSRMAVTSYNYSVLIYGQADSAEIARRYAEAVSRLPKVRRVYNEVEIGPRTPLTQEATDAMITSRAKIAIGGGHGIEGFDATRIKVVTENGVVYLMGLVTPEEADLTVEVVRRLPGVKRVVKLFEYVEPKRETAERRPGRGQQPA